jgi:hypothetical protein
MKPTSNLRLGKSTYNSGNPLSYSTIPDLNRRRYNFNMPKFGPDGKVIMTTILNNRNDENNLNNKNEQHLGTVQFDIATGARTDNPVLRHRNSPKESEVLPSQLGETYIHQNKNKIYKENHVHAGKSSGNMLRSSVIKANVNSSLKQSNLPSVGNKCVLQNSSVIQINTKFDVKNLPNLKGSINAGIGGKKNASRLGASTNKS